MIVNPKSRRIVWALAVLTLAALACAIPGRTTGEVAEDAEISAVINSPSDNSQVNVGQELSIQVTINDPAHVVNRQELIINDVIVATSEAVTPEGASAFSVVLPYTPAQPARSWSGLWSMGQMAARANQPRSQ